MTTLSARGRRGGRDARTERLAKRIARDLFTLGGRGRERADRLVMQFPTPSPLLAGPGWNERAMADRIAEWLERALRAGAKRRQKGRT